MRGLALGVALLGLSYTAMAEQLAVRQLEGLVRGFVVLRSADGQTLAGGDLEQVLRGGRVTNRLVFRFKDGSLHDETAVFTQRKNFRLLSYHLVQKGPAFRVPMEVTIDARAGRVTVRYTDKDGVEKVETENKALPTDLANGMVPTLAKNIAPGTQEAIVSMIGATPKPRLVKLRITRAGKEPFTVAGVRHEAIHYVVKVEIGGITGLLANVVGKTPPDNHVWVAGGEAPGFVKAEGPLYLGGPPWTIEFASPVWP